MLHSFKATLKRFMPANKGMKFGFIAFLIEFAVLIEFACAHQVFLRYNEEECFLEKLHPGDKMTVTFQVEDPHLAGVKKILHYITSPSGLQIVAPTQAEIGENSFEAAEKGQYTYCFRNVMGSQTPQLISFNIHGVVYVTEEDSQNMDPLDIEVRKLADVVDAVKDEQEYLLARERAHRNTAESTNTRVKWWSIFQTIFLVAVCVFQVFYLKRFFEVKRVV